MACRSTKRAEAARTKLLALLDAHIGKLRKRPNYDGHAHEFRQNVNLEIHTLDLASVTSVFRFAEEMSRSVLHPEVQRKIADFSAGTHISLI